MWMKNRRRVIKKNPKSNYSTLTCHGQTAHSFLNPFLFFLCVPLLILIFSLFFFLFFFLIWMRNLITSQLHHLVQWVEGHGICFCSLMLRFFVSQNTGRTNQRSPCSQRAQMKTCLTSLRKRWFPHRFAEKWHKCWNSTFSQLDDVGVVLFCCRQADSCACVCNECLYCSCNVRMCI